MRIVAGRWRGIRLHSPAGAHVRPTLDRVKESMFSMMGPYFDADVVVDLFAGSGSLGLEALSRGANWCVFVDKSASSLQMVNRNIDACRDARAQTTVWRLDWKQALQRLAEDGPRTLDWLLLDPPFQENLWVPAIERLSELGLTVRTGIVCEHPVSHPLPDRIATYELAKVRTYGDISVSIYSPLGGDERREDSHLSRQL